MEVVLINNITDPTQHRTMEVWQTGIGKEKVATACSQQVSQHNSPWSRAKQVTRSFLSLLLPYAFKSYISLTTGGIHLAHGNV